MSVRIHPTAVVDPSAVLGDGVELGPYVVIEAGVTLGEACIVGPHCRIAGPAAIGRGNRFESHCAVGGPPQDLKYAGELTRLEIGEGNTFREFVTINRGTEGGGGVTRIGSGGLFMAYAHVAHDCIVGDGVIFANAATLAGHVTVEDAATIGAFSAIHQFCRVGAYAFLGGFTVATKDCLPYMRTVGSRPAKCYGPNSIGLERRGFSEEARTALKRAWRLIHSPKLGLTEALERIEADGLTAADEVRRLVAFIRTSQRGVIL